MSGEILFLCHRMPFPPDRGDKIRSHHVLKALARIAPVHVATFADAPGDRDHEAALAALAASHCLVDRRKPLALAGLEALLRREPVSLAAFRDSRIAAYVDQVLATRPIAAIYGFSGQMGQYLPAGFGGRVVFDLVDVDSAKFEDYAATGALPRRWIDAREGRLLAREEARIAGSADTTLFVSPEEAALFGARLAPEVRLTATIGCLRNGIDSLRFDPALTAAAPELAAFSGPRLIFTGQMDYAPNIAAAERAMDRLLPSIRDAHPGATLHIVGRNPPAALRARHGQGGAHVWGAVAEMQAWLAGADLALVPLDLARGVQNKVLEAMAMGLPVVASPAAATGIGASAEDGLITGASDAELVAAVGRLCAEPAARQALGSAARRFVTGRLGWDAVLAPLPAMLGFSAEAGARDAA